MRAPHLSRRRGGISLLNALVLAGLGLFAGFFLIPWLHYARTPDRQNTCRSNLSNLASAMIFYDGRNGRLPGYMNALERSDGSLYVDPETGRPTAVSWCVELLPDLDRGGLYDCWKLVPSAGDPSARTTGSYPRELPEKTQLEIVLCPSVNDRDPGPRLHYVVNTGMPDLPQSVSNPIATNVGGVKSADTPRDWQANGVFFDEYSESPLVKSGAQSPEKSPAPKTRMSLSRIRDPKDKTILLTENIDAGPYSLPPTELSEATPARHEIAWGCTWLPGPITIVVGKPTMSPGEGALAPNVDPGVSKRPSEYRYARPSSSHPGGFNVAFAAKNVQFVSDKISYTIYAKLMASDDANAKLPGSDNLLDSGFRSYTVTDEDLNP
jgi:hypothetical protein